MEIPGEEAYRYAAPLVMNNIRATALPHHASNGEEVEEESEVVGAYMREIVGQLHSFGLMAPREDGALAEAGNQSIYSQIMRPKAYINATSNMIVSSLTDKQFDILINEWHKRITIATTRTIMMTVGPTFGWITIITLILVLDYYLTGILPIEFILSVVDLYMMIFVAYFSFCVSNRYASDDHHKGITISFIQIAFFLSILYLVVKANTSGYFILGMTLSNDGIPSALGIIFAMIFVGFAGKTVVLTYCRASVMIALDRLVIEEARKGCGNSRKNITDYFIDKLTECNDSEEEVLEKYSPEKYEEVTEHYKMFTCCVCLENIRDCVYLPCGHVASCFTCAKKAEKSRFTPGKFAHIEEEDKEEAFKTVCTCMVCRQPIKQIKRIKYS